VENRTGSRTSPPPGEAQEAGGPAVFGDSIRPEP
jgi:hypothetical protein